MSLSGVLADRVKLLLQFSDLLVCFVFKLKLKYKHI